MQRCVFNIYKMKAIHIEEQIYYCCAKFDLQVRETTPFKGLKANRVHLQKDVNRTWSILTTRQTPWGLKHLRKSCYEGHLLVTPKLFLVFVIQEHECSTATSAHDIQPSYGFTGDTGPPLSPLLSSTTLRCSFATL